MLCYFVPALCPPPSPSSRTVYEQLGRVGDVEAQVLCRQRAEEMEPSIRFCRYKMGTEGGTASLLQISSSQEGPAADLLQTKLQVRASS